MSTCDLNQPCVKCGRTWEDIANRFDSHTFLVGRNKLARAIDENGEPMTHEKARECAEAVAHSVIDRRASQRPDVTPAPSHKIGFTSSGFYETDDKGNYGFRFACDYGQFKKRKRKNKAARKARRGNR